MTVTGVHAELDRLNKPATKLQDQELGEEEEIVWCENPEEFDYVRVGITEKHGKNQGPLENFSDKLCCVGYVNLSDDAPSHARRRYFWVKKSDRGQPKERESWWFGAPREAVDPQTVRLNTKGVVTQRVLGLENLEVEVRKPE